MIKVLMVCLGNICRSPMAEGILRKKIEQNKLDIFVDSAGTANFHVVECPDARAMIPPFECPGIGAERK